MNKIYFYALLMHCIFTTAQDLNNIHTNINLTQAAIGIGQVAFKAICFSQKAIYPNNEQRLNKEQQERLEKIKAAEENLKQCLVANAYSKRQDGEFPAECESFDQLYAILAGFEHRNAIKQQFNDVIANLPEPTKAPKTTNYSTQKVIIIGGIACVAVGGAFFFLSPVIIPGTIIATKATAVTAAIKGSAIAAGAKAAELALTSKDIIVTLAEDAKELLATQTLQENIISINKALSTVESACSQADFSGGQTVASQSKSLHEQIVEKYFN